MWQLRHSGVDADPSIGTEMPPDDSRAEFDTSRRAVNSWNIPLHAEDETAHIVVFGLKKTAPVAAIRKNYL
jgi:hypothetical protein